jgi:hypothetical protein
VTKEVLADTSDKYGRDILSMRRDGLIRALTSRAGKEIADNRLSWSWKVSNGEGEVLNETSDNGESRGH